MSISRDGDSLFSGPCPSDWPIPVVNNFFWYLPGICRGCCLCLLPHVLSQRVFEEKVCFHLLDILPSHSWKQQFPLTHTLAQSSHLQAKQTHLSAFPCTLCAPALWPSWCPSAGFAPVCQCLSCTREPKNRTQHAKRGLASAELRGINHWGHAWCCLSGRGGHIPEVCLDCVFRMNTENEGIVSEASINQKPVNETLQARKSSSKCYCVIVLLLTLLLAQNFCHSCLHVFMMSTREGRSFNKKWEAVQRETTGMCHAF